MAGTVLTTSENSVRLACKLSILAMLLPMVALANKPHQPKPTASPPSATSSSSSTSGSESSARANSVSTSQGGTATSSSTSGDSSANSGGNSLTVSNRDRLQAPALMLAPVYASNPCAVGWSAGASVPGVGIGGGKARVDVGCERRELARVLTPLNPDLALKLLCADPLLADLRTDEACAYRVAPAVVEAPKPAPSTCDVKLERATRACGK